MKWPTRPAHINRLRRLVDAAYEMPLLFTTIRSVVA
jgi:hypothetical protein